MTTAIIRTGGKQFNVEAGQTLRVPSIADKKEGDKVDIEALFVANGSEVSLGGATVKATILGHGRADKIIVFKKNVANNTNVNKVTVKVLPKLKLKKFSKECRNSKFQIPNSKLDPESEI